MATFFSVFFCVTHNELSERGTNQSKVTSMYHIKIKKLIVATFAQGRGTKKFNKIFNMFILGVILHGIQPN